MVLPILGLYWLISLSFSVLPYVLLLWRKRTTTMAKISYCIVFTNFSVLLHYLTIINHTYYILILAGTRTIGHQKGGNELFLISTNFGLHNQTIIFLHVTSILICWNYIMVVGWQCEWRWWPRTPGWLRVLPTTSQGIPWIL